MKVGSVIGFLLPFFGPVCVCVCVYRLGRCDVDFRLPLSNNSDEQISVEMDLDSSIIYVI